jgi:hypothetical protein
VIYDFRYRDAQGKWKAFGHRKGLTRDAAFAALQEKDGTKPATEYMSRPRDGRTRSWDLFRLGGESPGERQPARLRRCFYVSCKAVLDQRVIAELDRQGLYLRPRSELKPATRREQHFLTVEAESGEEAVEHASDAVLAAGGGTPDLALVGSKAN